jgi:hypothetical protein
MKYYLNDNSTDTPKLQIYLNTGNLAGLPASSIWPGLSGSDAIDRLKADGYEGVQLTGGDSDIGPSPDFPYCGQGRISTPDEADPVFAKHAANGEQCITLHVGWGMEDDDEVDRLVESVLSASDTHDLPAFIETHRATITQDMWRTVQLAKRWPDVRFNGDFSHYYCGQEMVYGDFAAKLDFMQPIFDRIGFMHGRIAAPGFMQAPIEGPNTKPLMATGGDYLADFKEICRRAMAGFQRNAGPGDVLIFAPELLVAGYYYARVFPDDSGQLIEESDRYAQALLYRDIARECYEQCQ